MRKPLAIALLGTLSFTSLSHADEAPPHASAEATQQGALDLRAREISAQERPAKAMLGTGIARAVARLALSMVGTTYFVGYSYGAETTRDRDESLRIAVPTMAMGVAASVVGVTLLSIGAARLGKSRKARRVALAPYGLVF